MNLKIIEWEVPNPWYNTLKNQVEYISKLYADTIDAYFLIHIKNKPKRMKQENWEKMLKKCLHLTKFMKR